MKVTHSHKCLPETTVVAGSMEVAQKLLEDVPVSEDSETVTLKLIP